MFINPKQHILPLHVPSLSEAAFYISHITIPFLLYLVATAACELPEAKTPTITVNISWTEIGAVRRCTLNVTNTLLDEFVKTRCGHTQIGEVPLAVHLLHLLDQQITLVLLMFGPIHN